MLMDNLGRLFTNDLPRKFQVFFRSELRANGEPKEVVIFDLGRHHIDSSVLCENTTQFLVKIIGTLS